MKITVTAVRRPVVSRCLDCTPILTSTKIIYFILQTIQNLKNKVIVIAILLTPSKLNRLLKISNSIKLVHSFAGVIKASRNF